MDKRPIGVFDSGLGGLTVLKELMAILPNEDYVYFGDVGRTPYGSRSKETIEKYAIQDINFLSTHDVKLIVSACGTVSASLESELTQSLAVPFTGTVIQTARHAAKTTKNGKIGIIGTAATIKSGAHEKVISEILPDAKLLSIPCPLFVPLIEYGFDGEDEISQLTIKRYLQPMKDFGVDTLILGCTHYPLFADNIKTFMRESVTVINPGMPTAYHVKDMLEMQNILNTTGGSRKFYISDDPAMFSKISGDFLGESTANNIEKINIEEY